MNVFRHLASASDDALSVPFFGIIQNAYHHQTARASGRDRGNCPKIALLCKVMHTGQQVVMALALQVRSLVRTATLGAIRSPIVQ